MMISSSLIQAKHSEREGAHETIPHRGNEALVTVNDMQELSKVHKGPTSIVKQKSQFSLLCDDVNFTILPAR